MQSNTLSITTEIEDETDLIELIHNIELVKSLAQFKILEIKNPDGEIDCCIIATEGNLRSNQLINSAINILEAKNNKEKVYTTNTLNCSFDIDYYDPRSTI